jgi:hypothetical protein
MRSFFRTVLVLSIVVFPLVEVATGTSASNTWLTPTLALLAIAMIIFLEFQFYETRAANRQLRELRDRWPGAVVVSAALETGKSGRYERVGLAICDWGIFAQRGRDERSARWSSGTTIKLSETSTADPEVCISLDPVTEFRFIPIGANSTRPMERGAAAELVRQIESVIDGPVAAGS